MSKTAEKAAVSAPQQVAATAPPIAPANTDTAIQPPRSNGFSDRNDDRSGSLIKGTKLTFGNDYKFTTSKGEQVGPEREFLPIDILRVHQDWSIDGNPKNRVLEPNEPWPDFKKLNDEAPRSLWRERFGELKGPHEGACFVYLLDPKTLAIYTFVTTSSGGKRAVSELREAIQRAHMWRGPNMFPIVTLGNTLFSKKYNRDRPDFVVKMWVPIGTATAAPAQIEKKKADLDDSIPFK